MNVAIIPARGGSKRIPRKNIKLFAGQPMLSYAVKVAFRSQLFDDVLVSSEDDEILELAQRLGATAIERPIALSDDFTPTVPVVVDAIQQRQEKNTDIDSICCIYPTVPFLESKHLEESFYLFKEIKIGYLFTVGKFPSMIQRAFYCSSDRRLHSINEQCQDTRTQDLQESYYDVGQFYWGRKETWLSVRKIHQNGYGYLLPNWMAIDIDTPEDWHRAELIYKSIRHKEKQNEYNPI